MIGILPESFKKYDDNTQAYIGHNGEGHGGSSLFGHNGDKLIEGSETPYHKGGRLSNGTVVTVRADMDAHSLEFAVDGKYLGVAHSDLPRVPYYFGVSVEGTDYGVMRLSVVEWRRAESQIIEKSLKIKHPFVNPRVANTIW